MREHLVPTRVINKNGVATTVHKKPEKTKSLKGIPAPVAVVNPAPLTRSEILNALSVPLAQSNASSYFGSQRDALPDEMKKRMERYSTPLLQRTLAAFSDPEFTKGSAGGPAKVIANFIDAGEDETFISDCLVFMPVIRTTSCIRGMRSYNATRSLPVDESIGRGKLRDGLIGIMETVHFAQSHLERNMLAMNPDQIAKVKAGSFKVPYYVFKDERIIELILDRPEAATLVRTSIAIRNSIDYDVITEYVDGNALRDGTL